MMRQAVKAMRREHATHEQVEHSDIGQGIHIALRADHTARGGLKGKGQVQHAAGMTTVKDGRDHDTGRHGLDEVSVKVKIANFARSLMIEWYQRFVEFLVWLVRIVVVVVAKISLKPIRGGRFQQAPVTCI